jgi:hypothetical protein
MFQRDNEEYKWDIHTAMQNSYNVIINQYDVFIIIQSGNGWFAHDPSGDLILEDLLGILEYYEEEEDFIKCKRLNELIKNEF